MSEISEQNVSELELLEKVLLKFGLADSDEKLEKIVNNFLTPVLLKIDSNESVKNKVIDVLTHINKRLKSRPEIQLPMGDLIELYITSKSAFQHNFVIIYIVMGFPRLDIKKQLYFSSKLLKSLEGKPESHQDRILLLILPLLEELQKYSPDKKKKTLCFNEAPAAKKVFLNFIKDVLLLPYGVTKEGETPCAMSRKGFQRITTHEWSAEKLESLKTGIVNLLCGDVFEEKECFFLLVIASADTRFSVAAPALSESNKIQSTIDFLNPDIFTSFYDLFLGQISTDPNANISPCNARVGQKLLSILVKVHGKGVSTTRGIQVVFEGIFGKNTNKKCKILSLQFCENVIKYGISSILDKVAKVLQNSLIKLIGIESGEPNEVQSAAYSVLGQLAKTCPFVYNQDLKIVFSFFNNLKAAPPELYGSIRDALVSTAFSFAFSKDESQSSFILKPQQHLLLAMLKDNAECDHLVVLNATFQFLTICFPEYFAPSRFLLLLIAGKSHALYETIMLSLYGCSKKDNINYDMLTSKDCNDFNSRYLILPSFNDIVAQVHEAVEKRSGNIEQDGTKTPFSSSTFDEILEYLRLCFWYSAGVRGCPDNNSNTALPRKFVLENYEDSSNNTLNLYLKIINISRKSDIGIKCMLDLLSAAPKLLCVPQLHLIKTFSTSLKSVSESTRTEVARAYGILVAYGLNTEFEGHINEIITNLSSRSVEHRHGTILFLGHAIHHKIIIYQETSGFDFQNWELLKKVLNVFVSSINDTEMLIKSAGIKSMSLIGRLVKLPNIKLEILDNVKSTDFNSDENETKVKLVSFHLLTSILRSSKFKSKLREESALCLGYLAIGDSEYFTIRSLNEFISIIKLMKDPAINIAIGNAFSMAINGVECVVGELSSKETYIIEYLNKLITLVKDPNPNSRESVAVWLLSLVKNCSHHNYMKNMRIYIQMAFTSLLSDNSEFVQDVSSRGLALVFDSADEKTRNQLANELLDQMIGGKRSVNAVEMDTQLFPEGMLGKTPTGGNITTYKELCSLASDLNKPDMVYQFMQLANNNSAWTSKLGASFGLKSLSDSDKSKLEPYMKKIVPRLFRYKYDPTPKIQNSMISIWDSIISDPKKSIDSYYWDIMNEILHNITSNEWRVRIACCLAVRDLLKHQNGLKLRIDTENTLSQDIPEPELRDLWHKLFRVMDDVHEGTRITAKGTTELLGKLCTQACSSDHSKNAKAVVKTIIPFILGNGITHIVPEIRQVSIHTLTEIINISGSFIEPQLKTIIPALLNATGELEGSQLSYLSTRLGADSEAQEVVDTLRAESAKSHKTTEALQKCIQYIDADLLEEMTPAIIEISKSSVNLGTRVACAHFISMASIRLGKTMQPVVGKYLGVCLIGINDRNSTIRKYFANTIGNLIGIAKPQSIKNLFVKLENAYFQNPSNKGIPLTIREINNRHSELLKDYFEYILPLIFFAIHEDIQEENKAIVEFWNNLWDEISPGDAGISFNLNKILELIKKNIDSEKWNLRVQSGAAINKIFIRLNHIIDKNLRLSLINDILKSIRGRLFKSKEIFLTALVAACHGIRAVDEISSEVIGTLLQECKKNNTEYKTKAIESFGLIVEELDVDVWEELYQFTSAIFDSKDFSTFNDSMSKSELTTEERINKANTFNNLKEAVCLTLGRCWPKHSIVTQNKFQMQFIDKCSKCILDSTRQVQIACLFALSKFIERIRIFDEDAVHAESNTEKKYKIDTLETIKSISSQILQILKESAQINHTGIKQECVKVLNAWLQRVSESHKTILMQSKSELNEIIERLQTDPAPSLRYNVQQLEANINRKNE
ncbi:KIAA0368 family protein [Megaselia abdita]